ncbi:MAG TPA: BLUF domain-containing protein [Phycisphaerales bacterium]|nr:BLUF domain-containing protein [Phycisphaerales bacterium]
MKLRRLTYRSLRAPDLTDERLLRELIVPAATRNHHEHITGCLWVGGRSFVQIIEGPETAVHALMARIVNDTRHSRLLVLSDVHARVRLFSAWDLKWVRGQTCAKVEGLSEAAAAVVEAKPLRAGRIPPLTPLQPAPQPDTPASEPPPASRPAAPLSPLIPPPFPDYQPSCGQGPPAPRVDRERGPVIQLMADLLCAEGTYY